MLCWTAPGLHCTAELLKHLPGDIEREMQEVYCEKVAFILLCLKELCRGHEDNCRYAHAPPPKKNILNPPPSPLPPPPNILNQILPLLNALLWVAMKSFLISITM